MISRLVTVFSEDLHFELDKAKFVLLVVLHPAVVGAALHVNQLAGRPGEIVYMFFYIFVFSSFCIPHEPAGRVTWGRLGSPPRANGTQCECLLGSSGPKGSL